MFSGLKGVFATPLLAFLHPPMCRSDVFPLVEVLSGVVRWGRAGSDRGSYDAVQLSWRREKR